MADRPGAIPARPATPDAAAGDAAAQAFARVRAAFWDLPPALRCAELREARRILCAYDRLPADERDAAVAEAWENLRAHRAGPPPAARLPGDAA